MSRSLTAMMPVRTDHKACDLCYSRKKRCLIRPGAAACVRCHKSSLLCTASRQQPRAGRPPNRELPGVTKGSLGVFDLSISRSARKVTDSKDNDGPAPNMRGSVTTIHYALRPPTKLPNNIDSLSDIYMFGPTFAGDFHRALDYCCRQSPGLLDEIFRALESSLSWARFALLPVEHVDIRSGAASARKLHDTHISNAHDALGYLMLGQALAAFNSLIMPTGTASILRCSLAMVRPWYPDIARLQFFEPIAIAPVFWDIVWCLMHREVPIIKPVLGRKGVVDRVAGLCTTLLPMLYGLCVFSSQQRCGLAYYDTLYQIENQICAWRPDESGLASGKYSTFEILSMRTQATMYKTAGLLLIHRLRYPLGTNDQLATALANEILEARTSFLAAAGPSAKLQHMAFPVFLALIEVENPIMSVWENSTCLRARPICMDGLVAFHEYVCEQRRMGFNDNLLSRQGQGSWDEYSAGLCGCFCHYNGYDYYECAKDHCRCYNDHCDVCYYAYYYYPSGGYPPPDGYHVPDNDVHLISLVNLVPFVHTMPDLQSILVVHPMSNLHTILLFYVVLYLDTLLILRPMPDLPSILILDSLFHFHPILFIYTILHFNSILFFYSILLFNPLFVLHSLFFFDSIFIHSIFDFYSLLNLYIIFLD
ncbi:hypothetical protein BJX62DRAFT_243375 [Aspergillus germanicus]